MIWIVGAGVMAREYCKVLQNLNVDFKVIGRGDFSALNFERMMGVSVVRGGVQAAAETIKEAPNFAIVATPIEYLVDVAKKLISLGVKHLLIEKPLAIKIEELKEIEELSLTHHVKVYVGYNRRFYQSVLAAGRNIKKDGGLIAVNFEISEWAHVVEKTQLDSQVKQHWFLSNTSHVVDLVFYMAGLPQQINTYFSGALPWHPSASRFVGSGITEQGALFSYLGCWDGPGRWAIELITQENRYFLKPMEKLMVQHKGSIEITELNGIDYDLDLKFKPGLFLQVNSFLKGDISRLCTINNHIKAFEYYKMMAGYR